MAALGSLIQGSKSGTAAGVLQRPSILRTVLILGLISTATTSGQHRANVLVHGVQLPRTPYRATPGLRILHSGLSHRWSAGGMPKPNRADTNPARMCERPQPGCIYPHGKEGDPAFSWSSVALAVRDVHPVQYTRLLRTPHRPCIHSPQAGPYGVPARAARCCRQRVASRRISRIFSPLAAARAPARTAEDVINTRADRRSRPLFPGGTCAHACVAFLSMASRRQVRTCFDFLPP
ncbi:hypothetical protein BC628DRAFT_638913 [Trametes gibbosa]|nr:hypothetical protein BC628DRAFT_638913 [Trametes gibbosa]